MILSRRAFVVSASVFCTSAVASGPAAADPLQDFALDLRDGTVRLRPEGPETGILRYGLAQSPLVFRAHQGQPGQLRLHNGLARPTSLQICGLRGEGRTDDSGMGAGIAVPAGAEGLLGFSASEAGLAWFRPRLDPSHQAEQGAAGVLIVEPAGAPTVDQDLVVLLQDWTLDAENRLASLGPPAPKTTSVLTAGGKPLPSEWTLQPGARVRLRLINASVTRVMVVACEGARPMIVSVDGQPSELFQPNRDTVPIGPGARFEFILDLPRDGGQSVRLILRGTERTGSVMEPDQVVAVLHTEGKVMDAKLPIVPLLPNASLPAKIPLEASKRADLLIAKAGENWSVNGVVGRDMPKQPVLRVKQGDAVTLGFANTSPDLVPLSLFGQAIRLLHPADDGWEPYWRDTVLLPPGSRNHVAFIADKPGRWPIESGFATQAVAGLRCWFEVRA